MGICMQLWAADRPYRAAYQPSQQCVSGDASEGVVKSLSYKATLLSVLLYANL